MEVSTLSDVHGLNTAKAIFAMSEFIKNMEDTEIKPYLDEVVKILVVYITGEGQMKDCRYTALEALSNIVVAAQELILPYREDLINTLYEIVKNVDKNIQQIRGQALLGAGTLLQVGGKDDRMQTALEEFTKFALECLKEVDTDVVLRQTAISFFSEICKV